MEKSRMLRSLLLDLVLFFCDLLRMALVVSSKTPLASLGTKYPFEQNKSLVIGIIFFEFDKVATPNGINPWVIEIRGKL